MNEYSLAKVQLSYYSPLDGGFAYKYTARM